MSLETNIQALAQAVGTSIKATNTALASTTVTANNAIPNSSIGSANGVASLDGTGKVPIAQLPSGLTGGLNYKGTWNANTNIPTIPTSSSANNGWYYKVATSGATVINSISDWQIGDWIISNGTTWDKIDNTDNLALASSVVNGLMSSIDKIKVDQMAPTGGGNNRVFFENDTVVTENYTILAGKNAMSAGPVTVANGVTVNISAGSVWTIV